MAFRAARLTVAAWLLVVLCLSAPASAQSSGPAAPPAPQPRTQSDVYAPLYGLTAGISIPLGRLNDDHGAGYLVGGLVEYAVSGQPYSLRGEATVQRFPAKGGHPGIDDTNLFSLGTSIVYRRQRAGMPTFLSGGIGIYSATHEGTRPGYNIGSGIEIPLTGFTAVAEARLHVMLADARAILALPLSIGVRF